MEGTTSLESVTGRPEQLGNPVLFCLSAMNVARRYLVSGLVQGVGFRYFALKRAQDHDVRGFVQNLPDGRVEIVAEGIGESLDSFRKDLEIGSRFSKVTTVEESTLEPTGGYSTFTITR